jgi:hypothetical protein
MASITRFIEIKDAFDSETLRILEQAFDMACALLGRTVQPVAAREAIARNIIDATKLGERDPRRLRDAGLAALSQHRGAAT